MNCSQRNTRGSPELIVDTNILYSAILYPYGNPAWLLEEADHRHVPVVLMDYVLDELGKVLGRKGVSPGTLLDFLGTFPSVKVRCSDAVRQSEIDLTRSCVTDRKDRPIVAFALHGMNEGRDCVLVTGDRKLFAPAVKRLLRGRVMTASEVLETWMMGNR